MALDEEQTKEARGGMVEDVGTVDMTVMRGEWSTVSLQGTALQRRGPGTGEQGKL